MSQGFILENPAVGWRNGVQQLAHFYAVRASTPNRSCLMLYDVIHYNDVASVLISCVFGRNVRFIGV